MKKTACLLSLILALALAIFAIPAGAFTVTEIASYSPSTLYDGTLVSSHMSLAYASDGISYSTFVYQTELENPSWVIKVYHNSNEAEARYYKTSETTGSIPWFDIYEPNVASYIDIYLEGTVPKGIDSISLYNIWDTTDNKNKFHTYKSDPIPVYDTSKPKIDLTSLKTQLTQQEDYVNEMAQFTDVTPLITLLSDFKSMLASYEAQPVLTQANYETLTANMDSIVHSVLNYQQSIVQSNLNSVSSYIQSTSYYEDYQRLYNKMQSNDYSENTVSQSYALIYYAQQDYQNKENLKSGLIFLVIVIIIGGIAFLLILRNKNRKKMEEIF